MNVDKYSKDTIYYVSKKLNVQGAKVDLVWQENKISAIWVESGRVFSCIENCTIALMFENDLVIKMKSGNSFSCHKEYFSFFFKYYPIAEDDLYCQEYNIIATNKLKSIRITNGYDFNSVSKDLVGTEKEYFMKFIKAYEDDIVSKTNKNNNKLLII